MTGAGERPIASPTGTVHSVPSAVETSTRASVVAPAPSSPAQVPAGRPSSSRASRAAPYTSASASTTSATVADARNAGGVRTAPAGGTVAGAGSGRGRRAWRRARRSRHASTRRRSRERRSRSRNQLRGASAADVSSTRKRCAQTITGRQSTWSSSTIMATIATTAATIAETLPCSAAALM